mgnify:CR=1 FL=1
MYIPMSEKETRKFTIDGVELNVKPLTGENEIFYFEQVEAADKAGGNFERIKVTRSIFDFFVKGYTHPETKVEHNFDAVNLPSSHFGMVYINKFIANLDKINTLTVEEKKI